MSAEVPLPMPYAEGTRETPGAKVLALWEGKCAYWRLSVECSGQNDRRMS